MKVLGEGDKRRESSKSELEDSDSGRKERIYIRSTSTPKHYTYHSFPCHIENWHWILAALDITQTNSQDIIATMAVRMLVKARPF